MPLAECSNSGFFHKEGDMPRPEDVRDFTEQFVFMLRGDPERVVSHINRLLLEAGSDVELKVLRGDIQSRYEEARKPLSGG